MVVGISDGDERPNQERYWAKLRAIGYGFLVPVFFVTTGVQASLLSVLLFPAGALALRPWTRSPALEPDEHVVKL